MTAIHRNEIDRFFEYETVLMEEDDGNGTGRGIEPINYF